MTEPSSTPTPEVESLRKNIPEELRKYLHIFNNDESSLIRIEEDENAPADDKSRRFYTSIHADKSDDLGLLSALGATLNEDPVLAASVRNIHYAGNVNWEPVVCEALVRPCENLQVLKSMTTVGDWLNIVPTKKHLRRLYLYTSGDHRFAEFTLPKLLATLQNCPELEELRISGDFITEHTPEESKEILPAQSAITCPNFRYLAIHSVSPNAEDLRYLRELIPNMSRLELDVDAEEARITEELNKCFEQWTGITQLELTPFSIIPLELNFSPLTELERLSTNSYLVQPDALRTASAVKKLSYKARDIGEIDPENQEDVKAVFLELLKDKLYLPSLERLDLESRNYWHMKEYKDAMEERQIKLDWSGVGVRYYMLRGTFFEEVEKGLATPPASPIEVEEKPAESEAA